MQFFACNFMDTFTMKGAEYVQYLVIYFVTTLKHDVTK